MQKPTITFILNFAIILFVSLSTALPAQDTITVFTHHQKLVVTDPSKGVNPYPGWGVFPDNTTPVRQINMYVHFSCPNTDGMRCADWDYSDHILLKRTGGVNGQNKNWELGRIITPYGGFYNADWQFTWQTDVTDFAQVLRDSVEVVFNHSGYEPNNDRGWIVSIEFEIITGIPVAQPVSITEIYHAAFPYGEKDKPIRDSLQPVSFQIAENTDHAVLRVIQTGHGMDSPDNCAEFCDKYREIWLDGQLFNKKQMWMKCGDNPVYPQAGTWIFDRANWCPGHLMQPETFILPVKSGQNHTVHFTMEDYQSTVSNNSHQVISAYLVQYEKPAKETDVAILDVIVPSGKTIHSRKNPSAARPQILIKNRGKETIQHLSIRYGTTGFPEKHYIWSGSLGFSEETTISLPGEIDAAPGTNIFTVFLASVNNKSDEYPKDNWIKSEFSSAPVHGNKLIFSLLTNSEPEHNSWQLLDVHGQTVKERKAQDLKAQTEYRDTFTLANGAYSLHFLDTGGDGLEFWYNSKGGRGEARLLDMQNQLIRSFESDCGNGWEYHFYVGENPVPVDPEKYAISVYPARTSEKTQLRYLANTAKDVRVKLVTDPGGETVEDHHFPKLKEGNFDFDLRRFPYGRFYMKVFAGDSLIFNKRVRYVEPVVEPKEPPYEWPKDDLVKAKLREWQDWKFGVIIHWGPYSEWGVVESWSLCPEDEPWCVRRGPFAEDYDKYVEAYQNIRKSFNPTGFNPKKWAKACDNAGMQYVVFTTKHHDGFCMFDSKYTDYKITDKNSIFFRNQRSNVVSEVFGAFRQQGLGIGAYFSKPDWHHPDYWWPYFPVFDRNVNYNPEKYPEKWKNFQDFTFNQIEELMTGYGKIDLLWLDGGWVRPAGTLTDETRPWLGKNQWTQDVDIPRIAGMARKHHPGMLVVDRTVHGEFENYRTPEHHVPHQKPDYPWESCITLGDNWYSTGPNEKYKSSYWAIHTLIKIVAKGGNFLLGIGPDKTGDLVPEVYQRLEEIGRWTTVNGEAIYGSKPLAPYQEGRYCYTSSADEKSKYLFYLIEEGEEIPAVLEIPSNFSVQHREISLLGYSGKLKIQSEKGKNSVRIPAKFIKQKGKTEALVFVLK